MESFLKDSLLVCIFRTRQELGAKAAHEALAYLEDLLHFQEEARIVFAAAPSQNEFLEALCSSECVDWKRVRAFHMDEYIGLSPNAPQGFGNFLRERIFSRLPFGAVHYLGTNIHDVKAECARYTELLRAYPPDVVFMGVGENGHIAFNDPHAADFHDSKMVKTVELDTRCRQQQVNDGCFSTLQDVPTHALTLTVPALISCKRVFCVAPGATKAKAVKDMLQGEIRTDCPASILRAHTCASLYLDRQSASLLGAY